MCLPKYTDDFFDPITAVCKELGTPAQILNACLNEKGN